jgi:hypothetical protein
MVVRTACLYTWPKSISLQRGIELYLKKGKVAFAPHKTSFVKNNGQYCHSCKKVGHKEHDCKNKSTKALSS